MLRGLPKLVVAAAVAAIAGLAIGTAIAKLSGESASSPGVTGDPPAAAPPVTSTSTTPAAGKKRPPAQPEKPTTDARARVVSAILHPAASPSGRRRQRARLSVHVRVTNRGSRRITPSRPAMRSGDDRVKTDPRQDTAATHIRAVAPGATEDVTLRFELAGAVTQRVRRELRVSVVIAGKYLTASVKVGNPVGRRTGPREDASSGAAAQPPPPPVAARPPAAPSPPPPPPPPPTGGTSFDSTG